MKTFQVVPNPYRTLDAEGTPIAIYPCHAKHAPGEYVGAKLKLNVLAPAETMEVKRKDRKGKESVQTLQTKAERAKASFDFTTIPVHVPAHGVVWSYYRAGIRDGVLIAADAATAQAAGVEFVPVAEVLKREAEKAAAEFAKEKGFSPEWAKAAKQPAPVMAPK